MNKVYHGFSHCSGVYKITNKNNGLVYFGQATQLGTRAQQHEKSLVKNKHDNSHLQHAWNKYGSDAFEFEVIAVYPDKTERDAAEQALIEENYGPGCYNIMKTVHPAQGTWSHTPEETRAKKSANMKGNTWNKGLKHSPETSAKMSAAMKGKKHKPWTQDQKDAKSAARTGKKLPQDWCDNISAGQTGKKRSPTACANMKAAQAKRRAAEALLP